MADFFRIVRAGVACILLLVFTGMMYPVFMEAEDWMIAFVIVLPLGVVGATMLRGVLRERKRVAREDADTREIAVLRLAEAEGGTLTATLVASRKAWTMEMALATLRAVEDGTRVVSTVTDKGVLVFEFRELIHDAARRAESLPAPEPAVATSAAERPEPAR